MPCDAYSVIPVEGGWVVELENVRLGPYQGDDIALRVAVTEALQQRRQGQSAKVSVKDRYGDICAEYCLCNDFKIAVL